MAVTPRLEIKQSQSLLMTPQLRQAINLLQMSNLELGELVERELENNPLLQREEESLNQPLETPSSIDDYPDSSAPSEIEDFSPDVDYDNQFGDDYGSDRQDYELEPDYGWSDYNEGKEHKADNDFDYFEKKLSSEQSLFRLIDEQISLKFTNPKDKLIASALSEGLDDAGYFRGDINKLALRLNVKPAIIKNILTTMKGFEPAGLFAENLAECLSIQLQDIDRFDPQMAKLIDNLDLLAERKFKELKKICQASDEDLASMVADIKSLNPKPAGNYAHDLTAYVIPDVYVKTNKAGDYLLELNSLSLPKVLINQQYYSEIKNSASNEKEAKRYLKEQMGNASFLIRALHQRATTILRVSEEIVKSQHDFFEKGIEHLKPMALKDIAEKVEMHESTVSRVTSNKFMHTPRGLFELKYFFSAAAGTYTGDEDTSTLTIKHKIKKLIEEETPEQILSDDKIVELLAREGIKIARRTVTKYREAQNIPTSALRKRQKRNQF